MPAGLELLLNSSNQKQSLAGVLLKRFPKNFRKIQGKRPVLESLCDKVVGGHVLYIETSYLICSAALFAEHLLETASVKTFTLGMAGRGAFITQSNI